jgi:hypothetical protein
MVKKYSLFLFVFINLHLITVFGMENKKAPKNKTKKYKTKKHNFKILDEVEPPEFFIPIYDSFKYSYTEYKYSSKIDQNFLDDQYYENISPDIKKEGVGKFLRNKKYLFSEKEAIEVPSILKIEDFSKKTITYLFLFGTEINIVIKIDYENKCVNVHENYDKNNQQKSRVKTFMLNRLSTQIIDLIAYY